MTGFGVCGCGEVVCGAARGSEGTRQGLGGATLRGGMKSLLAFNRLPDYVEPFLELFP